MSVLHPRSEKCFCYYKGKMSISSRFPMKKRSSNEDSLASEAASKTEGKGSSAEDES